LEAAKSVIQNMIEGLAQSGYMRYAPDGMFELLGFHSGIFMSFLGHFVFSSFASAFLLKVRLAYSQALNGYSLELSFPASETRVLFLPR
jgi:hypothetical protein